MRRPLVAGLAACLLLGAAVAPATAAKKKPKKKPPVSFEEAGSVALGHPGDLNEVNVTRTAFLQSCAIPPSQGTDGYVIALPPEVTATNTNVTLAGADLGGLHDLDAYFFDESCAPVGSLSTENVDEFGLMPAGTSYVLVTAFMGTEITFSFKALGV